MLYAHGAGGNITPSPERSSPIREIAAVIAGALLLCWPAFYNGYPLLYPDSISYLGAGRPVARALFLHRFSDYYGMRSLMYSLGIFPFHLNVTPWPVVFLQGLVAAYALWLVTRSLAGADGGARYLLVMALLSILTSASWYASVVLPDILGPVLFLCAYLLIFARDTLGKAERAVVATMGWWAAGSHLTHLALAAGVCALMVVGGLIGWRAIQGRLRGVVELAVILLAAVTAQLALHYYLYGKPALSSDTPPYVTARLIADGTGRLYLEQHCGEQRFALCDELDRLPDTSDDFLWGPGGIWARAARRGDARIREEEGRFLLAVLRTYPREQTSIFAANFWQQLSAFGLWDLESSDWMLSAFDGALPGDKPNFLGSREARDGLPLDFFSSAQYWTIVASLAAMVLLLPVLLRKAPAALVGLSAVILPTLVANAFVTGALSNVEERYQSRVIWLVPLLAALWLFAWLDARRLASRGCGSATWHERN